MEQVGVEFFFNAKQAVQGTLDLGKRFFNLDKAQTVALKSFNTFRTVASTSFNNLKNAGTSLFNGLTKIGNALQRNVKSGKEFGESTAKALGEAGKKASQVGTSAFQVAKGFLMANVAMKGFNALSQAVPAIGQTFEQMGRVISANVVYPLVQEFIPVLKSMMSWVSKNRAVFAQLGKVVANIFRAIFQAVKMVITSVTNLFTRMWETVFGKGQLTFKKFLDFLNLLTLKIAFIVTFIGLLLEPIFEGIANGFSYAWNNFGKKFFQDFANGASEILPAIAKIGQFLVVNLFDVFKSLVDLVGSFWNGIVKPFLTGFWKGITKLVNANGKFLDDFQELFNLFKAFIAFVTPGLTALAPVFKLIGFLIGGVIGLALKTVIRFIVVFIKEIRGAYNSIAGFIDNIRTLYTKIVDWFLGIGKAIKDGIVAGVNSAKDFIKGSWVGKALGSVGVDINGSQNASTGSQISGPMTRMTGAGSSSSNVANASYVDNKQIRFEITNPDPKEVANEIQRKIQEQDNIKKRFQKSARMQGRD